MYQFRVSFENQTCEGLLGHVDAKYEFLRKSIPNPKQGHRDEIH